MIFIHSRVRSVLMFLTILFLSPALFAVGSDTPPLSVKAYTQLDFPPQLSKSELEHTLTLTAARLYGEAFVDLGDMSDLMHGHALFYPLDASAPRPKEQLTKKGLIFPWHSVGLRAVLYHTQEYPHLRKGQGYRNEQGDLLDPLNRNWLFWSMQTEFGMRGDLASARLFDRRPLGKVPPTVSSRDLKPEIFGQHASAYEYSFYFFRVLKEDVEKLDLSAEEMAASNILKIPLAGRDVYLVLVSHHCRNHFEDKTYCGGVVELPPYYK